MADAERPDNPDDADAEPRKKQIRRHYQDGIVEAAVTAEPASESRAGPRRTQR